jgi:ethanolamine utilization protein EutM
MQDSLGIIETIGFTTAIAAADAAVKTANVKLTNCLKVGGGKVNIVIRGEIAAVKAAVEAGVSAASQIGEVKGQTIIPRPAEKLTPVFPIDAKK